MKTVSEQSGAQPKVAQSCLTVQPFSFLLKFPSLMNIDYKIKIPQNR